MTQVAKNFLAKAFPVPPSLMLSRISLSLFDGELSFFEMGGLEGRLYPKNYGIVPFVNFRVGKMDEEHRMLAIADLQAFSKAHGYRYANVVIQEADAYVFRLNLPTLDTTQLRSAIESVLEENVPINPSETVFEYSVIHRDPFRSETVVAVSAVSEKTIASYADLLNSAGIVPVSFETEARVLARTFFVPSDKTTVLLLSIGLLHSIVAVVEKGAPVFSSSIDVGSRDIDLAISKIFGVTESEARVMKKEKSLGEDAKKTDPVFDASLPVFSVLHDELAKVLVFWKTQEKKIKDFEDISRVVLSGSDSLISSFERYISLSFKLPVEVGSVWTNILAVEDHIPQLSRRDSLDYGSLIGMLL